MLLLNSSLGWFVFFPRSFRGGTPRNQRWCRGWFPGRGSGEKLSLPVLGLPRDLSAAAVQGRSHPLGHPREGSGIFPSIRHYSLQAHPAPEISSTLRNKSNRATYCFSYTAAGVVCSSSEQRPIHLANEHQWSWWTRRPALGQPRIHSQ